MYGLMIVGQSTGALRGEGHVVNLVKVAQNSRNQQQFRFSPEEVQRRRELFGTEPGTFSLFPVVTEEPLPVGEYVCLNGEFQTMKTAVPYMGPGRIPLGGNRVEDGILIDARVEVRDTTVVRGLGPRVLAHPTPEDSEGRRALEWSGAFYMGHITFSEDLGFLTSSRRRRQPTANSTTRPNAYSAGKIKIADGEIDSVWIGPYSSERLERAAKTGRIVSITGEVNIQQTEDLRWRYRIAVDGQLLRRSVQSIEEGETQVDTMQQLTDADLVEKVRQQTATGSVVLADARP